MFHTKKAIIQFLADNSVAEPQKLRVAIIFAESMVKEMKVALQEWEETLASLQLRRKNAENRVQ